MPVKPFYGVVHVDQATQQRIIFPCPGWTVKQHYGGKDLFVIDPQGNSLRLPDGVARHLAQSILSLHGTHPV